MSHLAPIYAVWDDNAEAMAKDIGEPGVKVRQWRNRGNIPSDYWPRIIDAAGRRGATLVWEQFFRPAVAVCGVCDKRASDPAARGCTYTGCGLRSREAA